MINENKIYSVSDATTLIKSVLEMNIPPIWVEGELSSWMRAASGHLY
ncbi:exodeoxyribonuclease VII large subunit, partial [Candidatus Marinimicrobia bacterium MT.SAG.4]